MKVVFYLISIALEIQAQGPPSPIIGMPCADSKIHAQRSQELQKIREADQADRLWQTKGVPPTQNQLNKMSKNDLVRRKRIGEIFGEGCLKNAEDYEAAFWVYQHGNTSDQYFQAFLWSKRAWELGKTELKGEVAMAVDRYLVSIDHKQLFGTQATQEKLGDCWCIQPIETGFPQSIREEYRGGNNSAYTGLAYLKILNAGTSCPASYCSKNLKPSPRGMIPGFW